MIVKTKILDKSIKMPKLEYAKEGLSSSPLKLPTRICKWNKL